MDIPRRRFLGRRNPGPAPFRPPWSLPEGLFVDRCSRCDDCIKVCPTGLLMRGEGGFPSADFMRGPCTFCGECASACATGAIGRDSTRKTWSFAIAIDDECLAVRNVDCRVCGEACDAGAIRFHPRIGGVPLPEVNNASCNGCGACLAPCPARAVRRVATFSELELA